MFYGRVWEDDLAEKIRFQGSFITNKGKQCSLLIQACDLEPEAAFLGPGSAPDVWNFETLRVEIHGSNELNQGKGDGEEKDWVSCRHFGNARLKISILAYKFKKRLI